jgi:hypothetical protein
MQINLYTVWAIDNAWGFELTQGEYSGTVIQIEDVGFVENDDSGNMELKYHVLSTPPHIQMSVTEDDAFKIIIGECMNSILKTALEEFSEDK